MTSRHAAVAVLLCLVLSTLAGAQLSGTYTIDPNGSGSRNYTTFGAAVSALSGGVSGPVVFGVASTTFRETLAFAPVTGASATNTITFLAAGAPAVIDANGGAYAVDFNAGCQWFVFENLEVKNFVTMGMRFLYTSPNRCQNIVLRKVIVDGPATTQTAVHAIDFAQSYFITAEDCVFRGGGYTIYSQGMYYSVFNRCEFDGKGSGSWVVSLWNANAAYCVFTNCFMHGASASGYAMYLSLSHYGTMFWHNVFIGSSTSPVVYLGGCCAWTRANSFRNNIVVQHGTGAAMQYASSGTKLEYNDADYNCYYAPNATAGAIKLSTAQSGFSQGTLAAWKTYLAANPGILYAGGGTQYDQNSIEANPLLVSATAPYDLHIQSGSPCLDAGTQQLVPGGWLGYPPAAAPNLPTTVPADFEGDARDALPDIGVDEMAIQLIGSGSGQIGTTITFMLLAGADAGLPYQMGSSLGGGPIVLGTRKIELSPDSLLVASTGGTLPSVFQNYGGLLDSKGQATAKLVLPNAPALRTLRIYTAFVTLKASAPLGISNISGAFLFTIK